MRPPLERQEAERLVETYSDLVLRLSYSYLNQTQDAQDICLCIIRSITVLTKSRENSRFLPSMKVLTQERLNKSFLPGRK